MKVLPSHRLYSYRFVLSLLAIVVIAAAGCPKDTTPPGNVTGFAAGTGDTKLQLSWTNPSDADFAGVQIQRKQGGYPAGPTDGATVYHGAGTTFTDTGLVNGTPYYYAAFAFDSSDNLASGVQAMGTPTVAAALLSVITGFGEARTHIEGSPGELLPAVQRGPLDDLLTQAEELYRGGDTCGSASALKQYESLAQTDREAADQADIVRALETLYNLGRRLRYDMIEGTSNKDLCAGEERVGEVAEAAVDEGMTDNTQVIASAHFGEPKMVTRNEGDDVYTEVMVPGADAATQSPGDPAVPMFRRMVGVPDGAEVSWEFSAHEAETVHLNLFPAQQQAVDEDPGPAPDPGTFADPPFARNDQAYQNDSAFPSDVVTITEVDKVRDLRVFAIDIAGGQYNAKANALKLFDKVDVAVKFKGGTGAFISDRTQSPFESNPNLYAGLVLNHSSIGKYVAHIPFRPISIGEEFMILTTGDLLDAANTLATWKNQKGILTHVFRVGSGTDYTTNTSIQSIIKREFENAIVRPSYVLLLGDANLIPPFYETPNGDVGSDMIGTDYPYAAFEGIFHIFPSVALGRIPVKTLADANTVVNKIVNYEKSPPGFGSMAFYTNAAIASQFQCCATGGASPGTDQRTFIATSEFVRNTLENAGYDVQRIYTRTIDGAYMGDTTPRRYFDGTLLPGDLGAGSGFGWNGNNTDIVNSFNAGKFLFIHRDHGWPGGWGNPPFDWNNASSATNGSLLPVVFSVNCASGLFDNETAGGAIGTNPGNGYVYFAERLLINPNGGAVGVLGDTRNSPSSANSALLRGFIDAIWPNAIPTFGDPVSHRRLGDILNHAKFYLFTQGSTSGPVPWGDVGDEFKMWHCLGDPTLEIWTGFPYHLILPSVFASAILNKATVDIQYDALASGATITALQQNPTNGLLVPIGRAKVTGDGSVSIPLFEQPTAGTPIQYAVTLNDSVSVNIVQ